MGYLARVFIVISIFIQVLVATDLQTALERVALEITNKTLDLGSNKSVALGEFKLQRAFAGDLVEHAHGNVIKESLEKYLNNNAKYKSFRLAYFKRSVSNTDPSKAELIINGTFTGTDPNIGYSINLTLNDLKTNSVVATFSTHIKVEQLSCVEQVNGFKFNDGVFRYEEFAIHKYYDIINGSVDRNWYDLRVDYTIDQKIDEEIAKKIEDSNIVMNFINAYRADKLVEIATEVFNSVALSYEVKGKLDLVSKRAIQDMQGHTQDQLRSVANNSLACMKSYLDASYGPIMVDVFNNYIEVANESDFKNIVTDGNFDGVSGAGESVAGAVALMISAAIRKKAAKKLRAKILKKLVPGAGLLLILKEAWDANSGEVYIELGNELKKFEYKRDIKESLTSKIESHVVSNYEKVISDMSVQINELYNNFRNETKELVSLVQSNSDIKDIVLNFSANDILRINRVLKMVKQEEFINNREYLKDIAQLPDDIFELFIKVLKDTSSIKTAYDWTLVAGSDLTRVLETGIHKKDILHKIDNHILRRVIQLKSDHILKLVGTFNVSLIKNFTDKQLLRLVELNSSNLDKVLTLSSSIASPNLDILIDIAYKTPISLNVLQESKELLNRTDKIQSDILYFVYNEANIAEINSSEKLILFYKLKIAIAWSIIVLLLLIVVSVIAFIRSKKTLSEFISDIKSFVNGDTSNQSVQANYIEAKIISSDESSNRAVFVDEELDVSSSFNDKSSEDKKDYSDTNGKDNDNKDGSIDNKNEKSSDETITVKDEDKQETDNTIVTEESKVTINDLVDYDSIKDSDTSSSPKSSISNEYLDILTPNSLDKADNTEESDKKEFAIDDIVDYKALKDSNQKEQSDNSYQDILTPKNNKDSSISDDNQNIDEEKAKGSQEKQTIVENKPNQEEKIKMEDNKSDEPEDDDILESVVDDKNANITDNKEPNNQQTKHNDTQNINAVVKESTNDNQELPHKSKAGRPRKSEQTSEDKVSVEQKPKRRGRPPKNKANDNSEFNTNNSAKESAKQAQEPKKKRGPGRPRKSEQASEDKASAEQKPKRRGRPPKNRPKLDVDSDSKES